MTVGESMSLVSRGCNTIGWGWAGRMVWASMRVGGVCLLVPDGFGGLGLYG